MTKNDKIFDNLEEWLTTSEAAQYLKALSWIWFGLDRSNATNLGYVIDT